MAVGGVAATGLSARAVAEGIGGKTRFDDGGYELPGRTGLMDDLERFLLRRELGLVWMREWRVSSSRREKRLLHPGNRHKCGFSPVWVLMWRVWCSSRWKALSHMGHLYGLVAGSFLLGSCFVDIMAAGSEGLGSGENGDGRYGIGWTWGGVHKSKGRAGGLEGRAVKKKKQEERKVQGREKKVGLVHEKSTRWTRTKKIWGKTREKKSSPGNPPACIERALEEKRRKRCLPSCRHTLPLRTNSALIAVNCNVRTQCCLCWNNHTISVSPAQGKVWGESVTTTCGEVLHHEIDIFRDCFISGCCAKSPVLGGHPRYIPPQKCGLSVYVG